MTTAQTSAKTRLRAFFLENLGVKLNGRQLEAAAGHVSNWATRVREIRNEEGWPIATHRTDPSLKPGEYLLTAKPSPDAPRRPGRRVSRRIRAQLLERAGGCCRMCGIADRQTYPDQPHRRAALNVDHIVPIRRGGDDSPGNLRILCSRCQHGLTVNRPAPPTLDEIMALVSRATDDDQRAVMARLEGQYEN